MKNKKIIKKYIQNHPCGAHTKWRLFERADKTVGLEFQSCFGGYSFAMQASKDVEGFIAKHLKRDSKNKNEK